MTRLISRFFRSESGSLLVFSLFLFIVILMICGKAVDLVRTEHRRVALQNTADTAALASSRLDQEGDARALVESYFDAAGHRDALENVQVNSSNNARSVVIATRDSMSTIFMNLMGINSLPIGTSTRAEQSATDIEISVVLDISSSMNGSQRLPRLKAAMNTFIDEIIPDDPLASSSEISVSIVPYSMTVNPGVLGPHYNIQGKHARNDCVWFENVDFETLAIDPTAPIERYSHYADGSSGYNADGTVNLPYCPTNAILPLETDRQNLFDAVDALRGWDATGIDVGVKWGLHLLDPSFRSVANTLIDDGDVVEEMRGRPGAYSDKLVTKILILMSDGENDGQRDLWPELREGPSPIFIHPVTGDYSVLLQDGLAADGSNRTNDTNSRWYHQDSDDIENFPDYPSASGSTDWDEVDSRLVQLDWPDVFNIVKTTQLAGRFFQTGRDAGYIDDTSWNHYRNPYSNRISQTATEQRLSDICRLARDQDVLIYGIIFDPPNERSRTTIRDCAGSDANFFPVQGLEISTAFSAIAREVTKLRLSY